jgi:hypothetical protein
VDARRGDGIRYQTIAVVDARRGNEIRNCTIAIVDARRKMKYVLH